MIIIIILIGINIGMIWWNSFQVSEVSNAVSDTVADAVRPVVDSIVKPIMAEDNTIFGYVYNAFIRKTAHALEFMMLGILLVTLKRLANKPSVIGALFIVLATAVTDEMIQFFNNRTDSVKDIVIDFCGSVAGMALVAAVTALIIIIKNRSKNKVKF